MAKSKPDVQVKITSAVAIDGEVVAPGTVVTLKDQIAKNLLHRGRAELATADNKTAKQPAKSKTTKKVKEAEVELAAMTSDQLLTQAATFEIGGAEDMDDKALRAALLTAVTA